ncbi:MG2 domain-containing protein [Azospirillum thermophilum]|uniref:MG2 domain-containing protein n=1 Tax=Azospirillum thermophilum TaxID=2202148 RepID=UPI002481CFFF|nr:alpha-2-macroglobulin [Azospirillum thermophilum]
MARLLAFLLVVLVASFPVRAEYVPAGLGNEAGAYADSLRAKAPPQPNPQQRADALKQARTALQQGNAAAAVPKFEQAITLGAVAPSVWLELSNAWMALPTPNKERALQAARLAYIADGKDEDRVAALWRMGDLLDGAFGRPGDAAMVLRDIQTMAPRLDKALLEARAPGLDARVLALRQKAGLSLRSVRVNPDDESPRVCFTFSDPLSSKRGLRFDDFLRIEPQAQVAVETRDRDLCLRGFAHGNGYAVTLRQGLPGEDGVLLKADETQRIRIPDRTAMAAFRGSAFILPRSGADGIPVVSVNTEKLNVAVYRIADRNLVPGSHDGRLFNPLTGSAAEALAEQHGELVWKGTLETKGERNKENTTALPFRQAVGDTPKAGLYVVTAEPADVEPADEWSDLATQWVVVSDIGLTSFRGADGITVFARSYGTAKPMPGVEVALVARNNAELARVTTDQLGRAKFPAGVVRNRGGNTPDMAMAYAGADFAMLDLTSAAFDLSDRGVGGRAAPGPMDAFVYTDRGVYRQGETVNLGILLRDDKTDAVENFPLTVKVLRPSGTEYYSGLAPAHPAGGFFLPLSLSKTAPLGGWQVLVYTDPKGEPVGRASFQVEDFVPLKLALEVAPSAPILTLGQPFEVVASGRFLYGPPAAGLDGTAEVALQPDPLPYPQFKDYRFGLVQEQIDSRLETLEFPTTDAEGKSHIAVALPGLPDTSRPLRAEIRVTLAEPGGRPARKSVTVPVRSKSYAIGLRPQFRDGHIGEGQEAAFDLVALAPDGTPVAKQTLTWELVEERVTFQWYRQNGRVNYSAVTRDMPITSGTVTVGADKPAVLSVGKRDFGRYRLEVTDKASGVATSIRFSSGWSIAEDAGNTPDKLEVTTDKQAYKPGETARLKITPPFAGEVLLTVATDRLFDVRTLSVPAGGTTVEVKVDSAWGPGAYVTATAFRPPVKGKERQPVRAIGLAWLGIDPAVRTLDVALDAPAVIRPRGPVEVGVKVAAAGGGSLDEAYVTLAAVDEGILRLTDFVSPQPGKHFFGKRMLGLDIRDDYGRLLDALDGPFGALRQGGDASGAGLPVVPFTVVSLFKGPVKVGADGTARISFDIPDFNGELRLMAVAYSRSRVGSAAQPLTVRDTLVADAITPRFLAPGDDSRVTLNLHNVEAAEGAYAVTVEGRDAVTVEGGQMSVPLAKGERKTLVLPLKGVAAGIGRIALSVKGPDGLSLSHEYGITVRPARPVETQFVTSQVGPGEQVRFDGAQLASFVPGTGGLSVSYSTTPPFDVAGILRSLDRYPYGCAEQTISRALPLLVVRDVELAIGADRKPDDGLESRVQQAVARTLDRQRFDGSFGLWSAYDSTDAWLTAYATEFLIRAKEKGNPVPDKPLADALAWLRQRAIASASEPGELAVRAYALHVLALGGISLPGPARYLHDTALEQLPTPLAKGQLGAALARMGDLERANSAFDSAVGRLARNEWYADYGSTTRDAAALIVLASEVNMLGNRLPALLDRLPASATAANRTNTQEKSWAVLAADTLLRGSPTPVEVALPGGVKRSGKRVDLTPTPAQLSGGLPVTNNGKAAIWQAVSVSGVPSSPAPAAREGLRIKRYFFKKDGSPVNLDEIRQNDVFLVVMEGESTTKLYHQLVVTHPLPAGWEIENPRFGAGEPATSNG